MVRLKQMNCEDKTYVFKVASKCDFLRGNPYLSLLSLCFPAPLWCLWGRIGGWLKELIQKVCEHPQVSISANLAPGSVRSDLSQEKQKQLMGESGGSRAALTPAVCWPVIFAITRNLTLGCSELGLRYSWLHPENIPSDYRENCRCPALLKRDLASKEKHLELETALEYLNLCDSLRNKPVSQFEIDLLPPASQPRSLCSNAHARPCHLPHTLWLILSLKLFAPVVLFTV